MKAEKLILTILFQILIFSCNNKEARLTIMEELGYKKDDILLIVHADDLGMHKAETDATIESFKYGMVKSTSIMVPCPDFDRAISILKKNPEIDCGIHLTLTNEWQDGNSWKPILPKSKVPSLYNEKGFMWARENGFNENANLDEALLEMEAQIQKVLETGYKPSHLDFHMGTVYQNPRLYEGAMALSKKYNIPMLTAFPTANAYSKILDERFVKFTRVYSIYFIENEDENSVQLRKSAYINYLKSLQPGLHALLIHPAYSDQMGKWLEMPHIRSGDFSVWTDPEVKAVADNLGVKFINYKPIVELQQKRWKSSTPEDM